MQKICKCGSTQFFVKGKTNHYGLYCLECGKWQKWLNKNERNLIGVMWKEAKDSSGAEMVEPQESEDKE